MGQIGRRRRQFAGKRELGPQAGVAVVHRGGGIDHQLQPQAGFLLELLDEIPLTAPENLPIQMPQAVTLDVIPVVAELDTRTLQHARMPAGAPALGRPPRPEHEVVEPAHRLGC